MRARFGPLAAAALLSTAAGAQTPLLLRGPFTDAAITVGGRAPADLATLRRLLPAGCLTPEALDDAATAKLDALLARPVAAAPAEVVTVTLFPRLADWPGCHDAPVLRATLGARGIVLGSDVAIGREISRVDVVVDGRLAPSSDARVVPLEVLPGGPLSEGATAFRLQVPLEAFVISERSGPVDVVLVVWRDGVLTGERLPVPPRVTLALWRQALALQPTVAQDAELSAAANRLPDGWTMSSQALPPERLADAALLARAFAVRGDSFPARALAHDIFATEPCAALDGAQPLVARRLFESARPPSAYCHARPLAQTALRGTLVPGLGQVSSRRRTWIGAAVFVLTVERILSARSARQDADRWYREYLIAANQEDATESYDRATAAWRRRDLATLTAGALWAGALAEALWFEWRLGERLRLAAPIALPPMAR